MQARQYYLGGARGIDTDALEYLSRTQPKSIRTVVVPNRVIDQPVQVRALINKYSTNIIELKNTGSDRFMIRNRFMVDHSTKVHAFYDFRGKGGTYNTIEYAKSIGRPVEIHSLISYDYDKYEQMSIQEFGDFTKRMKENDVNLSSIKGLLIHMILEVFRMTVQVFCRILGYAGCKTLEQLWLR